MGDNSNTDNVKHDRIFLKELKLTVEIVNRLKNKSFSSAGHDDRRGGVVSRNGRHSVGHLFTQPHTNPAWWGGSSTTDTAIAIKVEEEEGDESKKEKEREVLQLSEKVCELEEQLTRSEEGKGVLEKKLYEMRLENVNTTAELMTLREQLKALKQQKTRETMEVPDFNGPVIVAVGGNVNRVCSAENVRSGGGGSVSKRVSQGQGPVKPLQEKVKTTGTILNPTGKENVNPSNQDHHPHQTQKEATAKDKPLPSSIKRALPELKSLMPGLINDFKCGLCGFKFTSESALKSHFDTDAHKTRLEEKGHKCQNCPKSFITEMDLTIHKVFVHRDSGSTVGVK